MGSGCLWRLKDVWARWCVDLGCLAARLYLEVSEFSDDSPTSEGFNFCFTGCPGLFAKPSRPSPRCPGIPDLAQKVRMTEVTLMVAGKDRLEEYL